MNTTHHKTNWQPFDPARIYNEKLKNPNDRKDFDKYLSTIVEMVKDYPFIGTFITNEDNRDIVTLFWLLDFEVCEMNTEQWVSSLMTTLQDHQFSRDEHTVIAYAIYQTIKDEIKYRNPKFKDKTLSEISELESTLDKEILIIHAVKDILDYDYGMVTFENAFMCACHMLPRLDEQAAIALCHGVSQGEGEMFTRRRRSRLGKKTKYTVGQLTAAHEHSANHRDEIEHSQKCGCFNCCCIYDAKDVIEYDDKGKTALCPCCDIDCVIGDASGFELTPEFLKAMHHFWF